MSWWQANKLPADFKSKSDEEKLKIAKKVPQDTLLLSTAGASSAHIMQGIELLAKANPQAKWGIAPDNDQAVSSAASYPHLSPSPDVSI